MEQWQPQRPGLRPHPNTPRPLADRLTMTAAVLGLVSKRIPESVPRNHRRVQRLELAADYVYELAEGDPLLREIDMVSSPESIVFGGLATEDVIEAFADGHDTLTEEALRAHLQHIVTWAVRDAVDAADPRELTEDTE